MRGKRKREWLGDTTIHTCPSVSPGHVHSQHPHTTPRSSATPAALGEGFTPRLLLATHGGSRPLGVSDIRQVYVRCHDTLVLSCHGRGGTREVTHCSGNDTRAPRLTRRGGGGVSQPVRRPWRRRHDSWVGVPTATLLYTVHTSPLLHTH